MTGEHVPAAEIPVVLKEVSILFGDRPALDDLSLSFRRGLTTMVTGASGCGKSLALKAAAGLIVPDNGTVLFEGRAIRDMGEKEYQRMQARTGFQFQDAALWANQTLRQNLALPLLAADPGLTEADISGRIAEAFASVGLAVDESLRPATVSMGQRKMVSFLRAIITEPEILFLDDPGSFLDQGSLRKLLARVKAFKDEGVTIAVVTNNRLIGEALSDRVMVLSGGKLVADGPYRDIMESDDPEITSVLRDLA